MVVRNWVLGFIVALGLVVAAEFVLTFVLIGALPESEVASRFFPALPIVSLLPFVIGFYVTGRLVHAQGWRGWGTGVAVWAVGWVVASIIGTILLAWAWAASSTG